MPVLMAASSKLRPAKLRALVASRKPRYTQSAPWSTAALRAGRLPAGQTSSMGGVRGVPGDGTRELSTMEFILGLGLVHLPRRGQVYRRLPQKAANKSSGNSIRLDQKLK